VPGDRERLRATFDAAAQDYQQARPGYPDELYDSLIRQSGIRPGDRLLEIGCATGKATRPLARRGLLITCVEIGPALAAAARQELAPFAGVDVVHADFETWQPEPAQAFDLVFAATAWHWLDPALKYRRAWRLLRPAGHLAVWEAIHVVPAGGDTFFGDLQEVYDAIGEGLPPGTALPRPEELPGQAAEIEASGLFGAVTSRLFDWEVVYTAEEYIRLLDTFSGHIAMAAWQRDRLYGEIRRRLAARPGGTLRRHWGAVLNVARRLDDGSAGDDVTAG
jgi:SAM-dependent methyltransferase